MAPLQTVLVAVDASSHSARAWAWAAQTLLPRLEPGACCQMLCVAVPDDEDFALDDGDAPWTIPSDSASRRESLRRAAATAQDVMNRLAAESPPPAHVELSLLAEPLAGTVGATIAAVLARQPADLVVVGQRGLGAVKRHALAFPKVSHRFTRAHHTDVDAAPASWLVSQKRSRWATWALFRRTACASLCLVVLGAAPSLLLSLDAPRPPALPAAICDAPSSSSIRWPVTLVSSAVSAAAASARREGFACGGVPAGAGV